MVDGSYQARPPRSPGRAAVPAGQHVPQHRRADHLISVRPSTAAVVAVGAHAQDRRQQRHHRRRVETAGADLGFRQSQPSRPSVRRVMQQRRSSRRRTGADRSRCSTVSPGVPRPPRPRPRQFCCRPRSRVLRFPVRRGRRRPASSTPSTPAARCAPARRRSRSRPTRGGGAGAGAWAAPDQAVDPDEFVHALHGYGRASGSRTQCRPARRSSPNHGGAGLGQGGDPGGQIHREAVHVVSAVSR